MLTMTKWCEDAEHQFEWLSQLPNCLRPQHLARATPFPPLRGYHYDYVDGTPCRRWWRVMEVMQHVWACDSEAALSIDVEGYKNYIKTIVSREIKNTDKLRQILERIKLDRLTPVHRCHGDLTLQNVLYVPRYDGLCIIDPGHCRGLPCRELDESKILQSLLGWDIACDLPPPEGNSLCTFPTRDIHRVLLLTHLIRILPHERKHPAKAMRWVRRQIEYLMEAL